VIYLFLEISLLVIKIRGRFSASLVGSYAGMSPNFISGAGRIEEKEHWCLFGF
jgi:hypothetical protein